MRPRRLCDGTMFEPQVLKAVQAAYDQAWERISPSFVADEIDRAREQLADAIMNVAREKSSEIAMMRDAALRVIALNYPGRFQSGETTSNGAEGKGW
jgi:MoxR-like ATPase